MGFALFAASARAETVGAANHIAAELVAERAAAPGGTVELAIAMQPAPGWHGYWLNPGDAGFGMTLKWELPAGTSVGALRYPVPETLTIAGLMNHVYEHDYAVLVPLTVPKDAAPGAMLPVAVEASWLACTDAICVPEKARLQTVVRVGGGPGDARFDGWRMKLPAPLGGAATFAMAGKAVRLAIPLPASVALEDPHVFVGADRVVAYAGRQVFARKGDLLLVTLDRATALPVVPGAIPAVLRLNRAGDGLELRAVPGVVPEGGEAIGGDGARSLPWLLLAALAGGLLLNVMPCVFPILSLKALSLVRAGESAKGARVEGVAYAAGVIIACLGLGAVMLSLRAAGEQVGWAFQLQEPLVVAGLLALAAAITANLAGVFEFAVPGFVTRGASPNHGAAGAFLTGLLAAFVATPCTGPFMAAAMGAALLLPVAAALALFATLGLGIALPFLALAFVPALRRMLPKPGAWMNTFRRVMAVPMALTALALLWLASRLAGWPFALAAGVVTLGLLAVLAGIGHAQRAGRAAGRFALATAALVAVAAGVLPHFKGEPTRESAGMLDAKPWSEAGLPEARKRGPVFAYFTADWCLTCKVNENVAIETEATRAAFAKAGVTVLRGDWTRRDPAITRTLTAHGAAGVPLYLWYPAGGGAEQVLPQVLRPELLPGLAKASR
ncbi:MAG: thioredoxin family protein [Sphingomonadales bacterium]|nr:thioredoxin family protein [Sphingomonadales bacterium]